MLPFLLVMVLGTGGSALTTINIPLPDQTTCHTIEQDINQQTTKAQGTVYSQNCYNIEQSGTPQ